MATISNNIVTEGFRGMIGNQLVFRQVRGKTIVSNKPKAPRYQSALQKDNRIRFRHAAEYAKAVMKDPQKKAYYQAKARKQDLPNAYTAALTDYMRKPVVKAVQRKRNRITVKAVKKGFAIGEVAVMVRDAQGKIVAKYPARQQDRVKHEWAVSLPDLPVMQQEGMKMSVEVTDGVGWKVCREL